MFYILIFSCLILSCTSKKKERRIKVDNVVDYREVLFGVDDSLPLIKIDSRFSANQVEDKLVGVLKSDICNRRVDFNILLGDEKLSRFFIHKSCGGAIGCIFISSFNEVVLNRKGMVLFERELVNIHEIDSLFMNQYFKNKNKHNFFTNVDFQSHGGKIPEDSIIITLKQVQRGYLLIYDSLSREIYDRKIDRLNIEELDSLTKILPYSIQIGGFHSPPPPAPENYNL